MGPLGRRAPDTWEHYERYPLTLETVPSKPVPVVLGVNWYENFDHPQKDRNGRWWIGRSTSLGNVRGGHCVCLEPGDDPATSHTSQDSNTFWAFYDQGREGACVGFGCSRMMTLLNRRRYDARWLWNRAKEVDDWPDTNPGDDNGTSVRAAMDVLRTKGHVVYKAAGETDPQPREGISANRWAKSADEVLSALRSPASSRMGAVRVLNSWGKDYPHRVWLPLDVLDRLIREDGEVGVPVDR